jgi:hypothetical protein
MIDLRHLHLIKLVGQLRRRSSSYESTSGDPPELGGTNEPSLISISLADDWA